jgi:hypothetical protein
MQVLRNLSVAGNINCNNLIEFAESGATPGNRILIPTDGILRCGANDQHETHFLVVGDTFSGGGRINFRYGSAGLFFDNVTGSATNRRMYMTPAGLMYVGDGTVTPTERLDVNGKIRMRTQTSSGDADDIVATKKYVDDNSSGSPNWGVIGGTLSDQTDLQTALNGKANSSHTHAASDIVSGTLAVGVGGTGISSYTTNNYIRASGATTLEQRTPSQVLSDISGVPTTRLINTEQGITNGGSLSNNLNLALGGQINKVAQISIVEEGLTIKIDSGSSYDCYLNFFTLAEDFNFYMSEKSTSETVFFLGTPLVNIYYDTENFGPNLTVKDDLDGYGLIYDSNYASTFIDRSLIDKQYSDSSRVSTQSNNTLSSNVKFWSGTKTNYDLLTPDSNTIYFIEA